MKETLRHITVAAGFLLLAVAWSYPLAWHLPTHLPGPGIGDNVLHLWNFWWMRTALATGTDFFHTPYRFAPVGEDLTLYTHSALTAWIGATVLRHLSLVSALNVTILASLALNGFCAYVVAWRISRDRGAAFVAGIIFGSSPYIAAHLNGHFDLVAAWTIPLFAFALLEAAEGGAVWAVAAGAILAATAYTDYYYVVYQLALAACVVIFGAWEWSVSVHGGRPYARWISAVLAIIIALDLTAMATIVATGGFEIRAGPIRILMRDTFNPLQLFWALILGAAWIQFRPRVRARPRRAWSWTRAAQASCTMLGAFVVLAAPLLWKGARLLLRGEYVTQAYVWRNAPIGIDVATLLLGNPFHGLWGPQVQHAYARMGIDLIESGAWLGIVSFGLAVYAVRYGQRDPWVRRSAAVAGVFFVWALGSHVHAGGRNVGLIMPVTLLRYVPIVSNARMPGRAMVVVYLAVAVLGALGVAQWRIHRRRPAVALLFIAALVSAESCFAPFPMTAIECPRIYQLLRDRPEGGSLAELPLSIGDGFGPLTPIDEHFFMCQMIHERPVVGGVTARLSPAVLARYKTDPLIAGWLRLLGMHMDTDKPTPLPDRQLARTLFVSDGIGFVILNRHTASPQLREYVERVLPLTFIAEDGERALYTLVARKE